LSRELHDSLAQRIGSLILKIDVLKGTVSDANTADALNQIANIKHDMQETYLEIREVIDQLRTKMPDDLRILPTLAQYTQEFSQNTGIDCKLYLADGHAELQPLATVEILRIVQEALNNVRKHSGANQIEVKFESASDAVKVIIKDNGKGFYTEYSQRATWSDSNERKGGRDRRQTGSFQFSRKGHGDRNIHSCT